MAGELDIYGIYVPTLLVQAIMAYVLFSLSSRWLDRLQASDWIALPSLFNVCVYIIIFGLVFTLSGAVFS